MEAGSVGLFAFAAQPDHNYRQREQEAAGAAHTQPLLTFYDSRTYNRRV